MSDDTPRWFSHRDELGRRDYAQRFARIAEQGHDIDGEARFVDALATRGATILDAGCGVGRVAAALARAGHAAYGVDVDPILIEQGRRFYPRLPLLELDLAALTPAALSAAAFPTTYDVIVCAGNVLHFVAEGSEARVVANLAGVLAPGGRMAIGFATGRGYSADDLDSDAARAGLVREHRFATWELHPDGTPGQDWAVSVFTRPAG